MKQINSIYLSYILLVSLATIWGVNFLFIKLAVADEGDTSLDSAVFLEAGSFDLGINLGEDILIGSGNEQCLGSEVILDTNIDEFLNYSRMVFEKDRISKKITTNAYNSYKINFSPNNSLKKFSEFINE